MHSSFCIICIISKHDVYMVMELLLCRGFFFFWFKTSVLSAVVTYTEAFMQRLLILQKKFISFYMQWVSAYWLMLLSISGLFDQTYHEDHLRGGCYNRLDNNGCEGDLPRVGEEVPSMGPCLCCYRFHTHREKN